jgi:hypothetical protein
MSQKIIFLDNDCVICLQNNWGKRDKLIKEYLKEHPDTPLRDIPPSHRFDGFDKKAVKVLNGILLFTGAEIVVSSDWKLHASLKELQEYYLAQGISKAPIATTPNMSDFDPNACGLFQWKGWLSRIRVTEIRKYLEEHPEVTSWVAIDDLPMNFDGLENFFLTDDMGREGIKKSGLADRIIASLNKEIC